MPRISVFFIGFLALGTWVGWAQQRPSGDVRESRVAGLDAIGERVRDSILRGDPNVIAGLCREDWSVAIGEDIYMACSEIRNALAKRTSELACRLFDTPCFRKNVAANAIKFGSEDLAKVARIVLSVKDIFIEAGPRLRVRSTFNHPSGGEDLTEGIIIFEAPDSPETHGDLTHPYIRMTFRENSWVLSALFPPF